MGMRIGWTALLCASSLVSMSGVSAAPIMIDFTEARWSGLTGQNSFSQTYGSLDVTLSSRSGALTFNSGGSISSGNLALHGDGVGIGGDEIGLGQTLNLAFSSGVTVLGYYLLDFFVGEGPNGTGELAAATIYSGGSTTALFDVATANDKVGFYSREGLSLADTTGMSFSTGLFQGQTKLSGYSDFALAGIMIDVASVPEPGALGLMGLGIAGLLLFRRRDRNSVPIAG